MIQGARERGRLWELVGIDRGLCDDSQDGRSAFLGARCRHGSEVAGTGRPGNNRDSSFPPVDAATLHRLTGFQKLV